MAFRRGACGLGAAVMLFAGDVHAAALPLPAMAGPLSPNANPLSFDAGPLGNIYVTGAVSGLAVWQSNPVPGDHDSRADLTNGQVFVQNTDGLIQFFVQAGVYSFPILGTPYVTADKTLSDTYGVVPQAFVKIAPADNFSVEVGKLPTLIGAEYGFTFENMNVQRGLLWYQEPTVSRGVQVNWSSGPFSLALSVNDGFYSNRYNWVSGSLGYTIDSANSISLIGGGNLGRTNYSSFANPLPQNNGSIYNLIYTHTSGPWTISPYFQYANVPSDAALGIAHGVSTLGGALLVNYVFDENWKLAGRVEYIDSSGGNGPGTPNLLYGPGSQACSFTITPTFQSGIFYARTEASYVALGHAITGFAFGNNFDKTNQTRVMFETGVLF
jgi:hypothetical protein